MNNICSVLLILFFFTSCSSLEKKCKDKRLEKDLEKVILSMEKIYTSDQQIRAEIKSLKNIDTINKNEIINSIRDRQKMIDSTNTATLIQLTKKYGFPSIKRTNTKYPVFLIFHHSRKYHHKVIKKIIDKEFNKGRLPENEYGLINWHLSGRKL